MSATTLAAALEALRKFAAEAGLDPDQAAAEGEALSAAVAESTLMAHRDWGRQTGRTGAEDFFDAAHRGRRWRGSPTALLSQLVLEGSPRAADYAQRLAEAISAAQELGVSNARLAGNAALAAAAQLSAVRPAPVPDPATPFPPGITLDLDPTDPLTPGRSRVWPPRRRRPGACRRRPRPPDRPR